MPHMLMLAAVLGAGIIGPQKTGEDLIREMHDRYEGKWYTTLILCQTVNYYDIETGAYDSARVWYESIQLPGTVRSDIAPIDAGNTEMFRNDSVFAFRDGSLVLSRPAPHPVLLLGFDVYVRPPEETLARLEPMAFDLSKVREDEWNGMEVYVVGSPSADDAVPQFWVDKEDLLVRRIIVTRARTGRMWEVRFNDYRKLGEGWIAAELIFLSDGRMMMREQYNYWDIDVEFAPSLFASEGPTRPEWVKN